MALLISIQLAWNLCLGKARILIKNIWVHTLLLRGKLWCALVQQHPELVFKRVKCLIKLDEMHYNSCESY